MIIFLGDSITKGSPGISYCNFIKPQYKFEHYGIGGNTITGLNDIASRYCIKKEDILVLEIGTNDILLPYLRSLSKSWSRTVDSIEKSGRRTTKNLVEFKSKYQELLSKFPDNKKILINIPCIGENTESSPNIIVDQYNKVIMELCVANDCIYVDFNSKQKQLNNGSVVSDYLVGTNPIMMIVDSVLSKVERNVDAISKNRGLKTTIDGIHLNRVGASALGEMLNETLRKYA